MTGISRTENLSNVGQVVIGRNEGERLVKCLASLDIANRPTVYVDSGSTDNSKATAKSAGCQVVALDLSVPFTAARARNLGFQELIQRHPDLIYVQFLDGDCQLDSHWISEATRRLTESEDIAVVCGRRRERNPDASIYNQFCDIEWNTPIGEAEACGGDFLIRAKAFQEVEGFDPQVIAGEEPEMCLRLRRSGWRIIRIDAEMTMHDADMHAFHQFARRSERSGHAFAQGYAMHGGDPEKYQLRQLGGILFWALAYPSMVFATATISLPAASVLLAAYPLQWLKITLKSFQSMRLTIPIAKKYALFLMLGKFFQAYGALKYFWRTLRAKNLTIIEYK